MEAVLVFGVAFEGFYKRFGGRLTSDDLAAIQALGINLKAPAVAYPYLTWEEMIRLVTPRLYPGLPQASAWRRMGHDFMEGFVQTGLGQAALMMGYFWGKFDDPVMHGANVLKVDQSAERFARQVHGFCLDPQE